MEIILSTYCGLRFLALQYVPPEVLKGMMQFFGRPKKSSRAVGGFTLLELLAVIAILGVLAGIAIPSIGGLQQNLEVTELDSTAREIFLAAQNNIAGLRARGALNTLGGTAITAAPSDFPTGPDAPTWSGTDYFYLTETSPDIDKLLPPGSIDDAVRNLLSSSYIIEFNRKTGEIYGVFYAETPGGITYGTVDALRNDKSARQAAKIGYYGGAASALPDTTNRTPAPIVQFINGEELYIALGTNILDFNDNDIVFTLTLQNPAVESEKFTFKVKYEGAKWILDAGAIFTTDKALTQPGATTPLKILLDSLEPGKHFHELLPDFTPGCDLMLTVTAQRTPDVSSSKTYFPSDKITAQANSLFASVDTSGARPLLELANGRHLQNLENSLSGFAPPASGVDARQTAEIDWTYWNEHKDPDGIDDPISFTAIHITMLKNLDGQGNAIRNLNITGNDKVFPSGMGDSRGAGLFAYIQGCTLSRVRIVKGSLAMAIQGGNIHYLAGGLAGCANNCTITDCAASLERMDVSGELYRTYKRHVGGLIGYAGGNNANRVTIKNSYANTGVLHVKTYSGKYDRLGAFIGTLANGSATNCYALGQLTLECLTPNASATALTDPANVSGFANADNSGYFTNCYTAATYGPAMHDSVKVHAFCNKPETNNSNRFFLRTAGITEIAETTANGMQNYGVGKTYAEMTDQAFRSTLGGAWAALDAAHTEPYPPQTGSYPFPGLTEEATPNPLITHYGNWPGRIGDAHLLYYEKYTIGADGYYAESLNTNTLDNLNASIPNEDDMRTISADGYAVLIEHAGTTPPSPIPVFAYDAAGARMRTSLSRSETISLDGKTYSVYPFNSKLMEDSRAQSRDPGTPAVSFYHKFICNGYTLFCNPHFAASAASGVNDYLFENANDPLTINIRTARQFYQLGQAPQESYWDRSFAQTHSINFNTYGNDAFGSGAPGAIECAPIGKDGKPFTGIYQGNKYTILNLTVPDRSNRFRYLGAFGLCSGTGRLANIYLINADVKGGTADGAAGILVGKAENQVTRPNSNDIMILNCRVYAQRATGPNNTTIYPCYLESKAQYIGGLIGQAANCIIQDSLASPYTIRSTHPGDSLRAGGFAGELNGPGTVRSCYANMNALIFAGDPNNFVGMNNLIGGFAGINSMQITSAYALGTIRLDEHYTPAPGDQIGRIGGFAASNSNRIQSAYTACTYGAGGGTVFGSVFGFAENGTGGSSPSCYYRLPGPGVNVNGTGANGVSHVQLMRLADTGGGLAGNQGFEAPSEDTITYPYHLQGSYYPFPFLRHIAHYGDWPPILAPTTLLAYCEKYDDGSYGYYLDGVPTAQISAPLSETLTVEADGYALLRSQQDLSPLTITGFGRTHTTTISPNGDDGTLQIHGAEYRIYRLGVNTNDAFAAGAAMRDLMTLGQESNQDCRNGSSFYYKLSVGGATPSTFYFNPSFAKGTFSHKPVEDAPTVADNPGDVSIRSARHLYNLGVPRSLADQPSSFYWGSNFHYAQERDVDFSTYDYSFYGGSLGSLANEMRPIGRHIIPQTGTSGDVAFSGKYNGNSHIITGTGIKTASEDKYAGLFGWNSGELKDIIFVAAQNNAPLTITASNSNYTGALAGRNTGTITNCAVAGFTITGGNPATAAYTGGFVGQNEGTIQQCSAVNYATAGSLSGQTVGGFVGNQLAGGIINQCYAIATVNNATAAEGGFSGLAAGTGISQCYCATISGSNWLAFGVAGNNCLAYNNPNMYAEMENNTAFDGMHADYSEPYDTGLADYPWPAIVTRNGDYYHYGDWPT